MPQAQDNKLYQVTTGGNFESIGQYLFDTNSPAYKYADKPTQFLNIVGEDGLTNRERIIQQIKEPELNKLIKAGVLVREHSGNKEIYEVKNIFKMPIGNSVIYIEKDQVPGEEWVTSGIEVITNNEPAFKSAQLAKLEADKGYVQITKTTSGFENLGSFKNSYPNLTVWIWCRAISSKITNGELEGQFFDLTPFIQQCTTNSGKNGGNFKITLPPLICTLDGNDRWVLDQSSIVHTGNEYMANGSMFKGVNKDGELIRNQFLFHNVIKPNDLIFIRFEALEMEKEQRYKDAKNYFIDKSMIAGRIYDMIGLVDNNSQLVAPASNDVAISITGRDLSKLFLDDGCYFYALENSQGMIRFAGQSEQKNSLMARILADGSFNFLGLYMNQSVDFILKFIIQQLSNIKIVPDNLFTSYGDRVNYRYNELEDVSKIKNKDYKPQFKKEKARGIWQLFKLIIDSPVMQRRIMDSSLSQANGSLINFLRSAIQEPFLEFFMDTYGDQFYLTVRKPPTDQRSIISLLEGKTNTDDPTQTVQPAIIDIEQIDVLQENLYFDESGIYSWYHFFPKANFFGNATDYSLSFLPAIYFEEYAEVWGSKPFQQCHNYLPYFKLREKVDGLDITVQQAIEDLSFVIESNQYNPFVRKGTILINGDRRIKIGNLIRYKATGEIFHVDHVQQSYMIADRGLERTTQVFVSRGMVEQLIYGVHVQNEQGQNEFVSYFNIIDTTLNYEYVNGKEKVTEEVPTLVKDTESQATQQYGYAAPGFCEYIQHQQGYTGARQLADSISNNTPLREGAMKRILNNVSKDYAGGTDSLSFIKYWLKRYNAAYQQANNINTNSIYEPIFKRVAEETGVPVEVLRCFAKIESNMGQNLSNPDYVGIMQIGKQLASEYKSLNANEPYGNIKIAAFNYLRNTRNNSLKKVLSTVTHDSSLHKAAAKIFPNKAIPPNHHIEYKKVEKEVTKRKIDIDGLFKNFRVNKTAFNFFLKGLQMQYYGRQVNRGYNRKGELNEVEISTKTRINK